MAKINKTNIKDLVLAKPFIERASFKGREIAKLCKPKSVERGEITVEITEVAPMEGGVTVFARAYKNGRQIGFGVDGTVDIERFRIYNPPILVPDGTKSDVVIDGRQTKVDNFVEDPEEALMQALLDTIRVMKVFGDKNIVAGKVGNTVSTFYASTADGNVRYSNTSFATARSATTATEVQNSASGYISCGKEGSNYNFYIYFWPFDTSAISASDTISAATFSVYLAGDNTNAGSETLTVCQSKQGTWNSLTTSDFDDRRDSINGGAEGGTRVALPATGPTSGYFDIALNATGISWIARSGETKPASASASGKTQLACGFGRDLDNVAPTAIDGYQVYSADDTGTSRDPKLVVTHSASVSVTVNATVVTATVSTPAPSVSGGAVVSPTTPVATFSTPAPSISGAANVEASVVTATFSTPAPNIITPDAQVSASVVTATFSTPAPTVSGDANVSAGVQTATFSLPASEVQISVSIDASPQVATFSTPAPTVTGISNITVSATVVTATFSTPSPTVSAEQNAIAEAGVVTATFTTPAPTVTAIRNVTVDASVVTATFSVQTPRKVGGLWTAQPRVEGTWTPTARAI